MTRIWIVPVLAALLCAGCTIGPKYQPPVAPAPVALKEMKGNDEWKMATPSDASLKGKWWEIFGDPELNRLEELVNINNQNVKQA
jgi:outer membrane protein TolC